MGTTCLEGRYFSIQGLPLDNIIDGFSPPEAWRALLILVKFSQQGGSFQVISDSISLVCNQNVVASAAGSSYVVPLGNQEQWQQLGLFGGSLGISWLITCRKMSHAQQCYLYVTPVFSWRYCPFHIKHFCSIFFPCFDLINQNVWPHHKDMVSTTTASNP